MIRIDDQHFSQRQGDIIYIFDCVSKIAKIDTKENCYDHIMVKDDWYVNPQTMIVTRNGTKKACNKFFPVVVNAIEGWVTINPHVKPTAPPRNMSLLGIQIIHESLAHGGIYKNKEVEAQIKFKSFHQAITQFLSYGVCIKEGKFSEENPIPNYDLNKLCTQLEENTNIFKKIMTLSENIQV